MAKYAFDSQVVHLPSVELHLVQYEAYPLAQHLLPTQVPASQSLFERQSPPFWLYSQVSLQKMAQFEQSPLRHVLS